MGYIPGRRARSEASADAVPGLPRRVEALGPRGRPGRDGREERKPPAAVLPVLSRGPRSRSRPEGGGQSRYWPERTIPGSTAVRSGGPRSTRALEIRAREYPRQYSAVRKRSPARAD